MECVVVYWRWNAVRKMQRKIYWINTVFCIMWHVGGANSWTKARFDKNVTLSSSLKEWQVARCRSTKQVYFGTRAQKLHGGINQARPCTIRKGIARFLLVYLVWLNCCLGIAKFSKEQQHQGVLRAVSQIASLCFWINPLPGSWRALFSYDPCTFTFSVTWFFVLDKEHLAYRSPSNCKRFATE